MGTLSESKEQAPLLAQAKTLPEHTAMYYLFKDIDNAEAERFCATLWAMGSTLVTVPGAAL